LTQETIIAPATPSGEGGLAVIRLSGPKAEYYLKALFRPKRSTDQLESHRLYLGHLSDATGSAVDEVMAVVMRAPHSFTREDVVEVHCHGGPAVVRDILDQFLRQGARIAHPGEFTQRAFINGRLDLSQAEAVADLIHARSSAAARIALNQLQGKLARFVEGVRQQLVSILSHVEVQIDFSDQDIEPPDFTSAVSEVEEIWSRLDSLLDSFDSGRMLHEGVNILILGKPNVGKSSLLNALLGEARAIVTDVAGTTRDTIEESLVLHEVPVRLIDTAGIRQTNDPVELEGVRRARDKALSADLVLLVVDGSSSLDADDRLALTACDPERLLLVVNKKDRGQVAFAAPFAGLEAVAVSARRGDGLDDLQLRIRDMLFGSHPAADEHLLIYERRHKDSLLTAVRALERFLSATRELLPPEFLALELRESIAALGAISGASVTEEVLSQIFAKFCIGK